MGLFFSFLGVLLFPHAMSTSWSHFLNYGAWNNMTSSSTSTWPCSMKNLLLGFLSKNDTWFLLDVNAIPDPLCALLSSYLFSPQAFPEGQPVGRWGNDLIVLGFHRFGHRDVHHVHPLSYDSCLPSLPCDWCAGVLRKWKVHNFFFFYTLLIKIITNHIYLMAVWRNQHLLYNKMLWKQQV